MNLLDFGCVRVFRASFVRGVIDLYHALERGDRDLAVHAYRSWGFGDLSSEMIEVLNRWARFVYGPLLDDRARLIQEKANGADGADVVESVHRDIRRLGGVRPPREFVFMDRAAVGLGSVFMHLKAEINWHRLFHELIEDFDETALTARQRAALEKAGVPLPAEQADASTRRRETPQGHGSAQKAGGIPSGMSAACSHRPVGTMARRIPSGHGDRLGSPAERARDQMEPQGQEDGDDREPEGEAPPQADGAVAERKGEQPASGETGAPIAKGGEKHRDQGVPVTAQRANGDYLHPVEHLEQRSNHNEPPRDLDQRRDWPGWQCQHRPR